MKPISTHDKLPPCANDGEVDVWWFNAQDEAWYLGIPLLMDLVNDLHIWTHWLPKEAIPFPEANHD